MRHPLLTLALFALSLCGPGQACSAVERLAVGSKRFTESYILGEIVTLTAQDAGAQATHRAGLGSTAVVLEALKAGDIDVYVEYLGTIEKEIVHLPPGSSPEQVRLALARMGLAFAVPLGFANGYALATTAAVAEREALRTLGDLKTHPSLPVAVSQEFLGRADGWPGLAARYGLPQRASGIDHGIAYDALSQGRIAVTDVYTTDARIERLSLVVLQDDAGYFPRYDAVLLYRRDLPQRAPDAWRRITALQGRIDTGQMIRMNAQAELEGRSFAAIAHNFLRGEDPGGLRTESAPPRPALRERLFGPDFARLTREHLTLLGASLAIAVSLGIPLGAWAATQRRLRPWLIGGVGLLQTVPSLALLAMLIPVFGQIGTVPAIAALALYALLPIVQNTTVGLSRVPQGLQHAAWALGLTPWQAWRHVTLPLAAPVILAGVQTAAVVTVGTATIAAFIGAGGYGERIAQGLALNDSVMLLAGAMPAAVLALLTQAVFECIERAGFARPARAASRDRGAENTPA